MMDPNSRADSFAALVARAAACRLCPAMEGRRRVLSAANGPLDAQVLFIAEAPGRFGGEISGVPLSTDQSGRAFERLIAAAGLSRSEIFVTNVVLCNPRDARGNNRPPRPEEVANCAAHLRDTLELIRATFVVTLGVTALRTTDAIERHGLVLHRDLGRAIPWRGRTLVPLYHPGPQAMIHRPFTRQAEDYLRLGQLVSSAASTS